MKDTIDLLGGSQKKARPWRKSKQTVFLIVVLVIIVLSALAGGAFYYTHWLDQQVTMARESVAELQAETEPYQTMIDAHHLQALLTMLEDELDHLFRVEAAYLQDLRVAALQKGISISALTVATPGFMTIKGTSPSINSILSYQQVLSELDYCSDLTTISIERNSDQVYTFQIAGSIIPEKGALSNE